MKLTVPILSICFLGITTISHAADDAEIPMERTGSGGYKEVKLVECKSDKGKTQTVTLEIGVSGIVKNSVVRYTFYTTEGSLWGHDFKALPLGLYNVQIDEEKARLTSYYKQLYAGGGAGFSSLHIEGTEGIFVSHGMNLTGSQVIRLTDCNWVLWAVTSRMKKKKED
jgi:hypothetical protein